MQLRYPETGQVGRARLFKDMLSGFLRTGVLSGCELGVAANDKIVIAPGWFAVELPVVENGVTTTSRSMNLVQETESKFLNVPITSSAVDYTVVYRGSIVDGQSGGTPLRLSLESGAIQQINLTDGIVLGYVRYTGGSTSLASSMLVNVPAMKLGAQPAPSQMLFVNPDQMNNIVLVTGAIPLTSVSQDTTWREVLLIDNSANLIPSEVGVRQTLYAQDVPPGSICCDYVVDVGQTVSFDIEDTEGNVSSIRLGSNVIAGMLTDDYEDTVLEIQGGQQLRRSRIRITNGTFKPGKRFRVQVTIQTLQGRVSKVASIGIGAYRLPFAS